MDLICLCKGLVKFFVSFFCVCILFLGFGCRSATPLSLETPRNSMVSPCSLWCFLRGRRLSSWRSVAGRGQNSNMWILITLGRLLCLWHMRTSVDLCGWSLELLRVLRLWLPWLIGRAGNIHLVRKAWWRHPMEYRSCEMKLRLWLRNFRRSRYKRRMILTCELIVSSWFLVPLQLLLVLHHGHF